MTIKHFTELNYIFNFFLSKCKDRFKDVYRIFLFLDTNYEFITSQTHRDISAVQVV